MPSLIAFQLIEESESDKTYEMNFPIDPIYPLKSVDEAVRDYLVKDTPLLDLPTIPEFYAGREIFVTGFSGFMGKVLIEKLLRSCPEIKVIYVLLRPKKGQSIEERLQTITDLQLFDVLRAVQPNFSEKIIPINGDVTQLELGMSSSDVELMKNVSIVFHSAASVRFDDSLKYAVLMNTRGTRELLKFAEQLKQLQVVLHVSTTFSNLFLRTVDEEVYDAPADWSKTIEVCEKLDDDLLNDLTPHYINFMPNTYAFTKALGEQVLVDYQQKLPIVLFRPSIVVGTLTEPFSGWIDNFNGPMGLLLGCGLGIARTMYCDPNNKCDFIHVDVCIKAMIIAAWKRAHDDR